MILFGVSKISCSEDVALFTVNSAPWNTGYIAAVFSRLSEKKIVVDMISQTAPFGSFVNLCFTTPNEDVSDVLQLIGSIPEKDPATRSFISTGNAKISLFGEEMRNSYGVASLVFDVLAEKKIPIFLITTSETDISVLVSGSDWQDAKSALLQQFQIQENA